MKSRARGAQVASDPFRVLEPNEVLGPSTLSLLSTRSHSFLVLARAFGALEH